MSEIRICKYCNEEKTLEEMYLSPDYGTPTSMCKECNKKKNSDWYKKNKAKARAEYKKYYEKNKERLRKEYV